MTSVRNRLLYGLCLLLLPMGIHAQDGGPTYKIEKMKGNVYRFTAGHYHSVFMVTKEGILLTDPINKKAAVYLKDQLKQRFNLPLRYMVYSHNHVDHVQGGEVFAESGVTVIAQQMAAEDIKMTRAPTAIPELTFDNNLTLELGDSSVELRYHGPNNGYGSVSMRFKPANVLFVVDWIILGRMPYKNLIGYDILGMINSTRSVLAMEPFNLFIGGHGDSGSRGDVEHYLNYLEALYGAVRDGMIAGKSLKTLQKEIQLKEFKSLRMYEEWLPLNIQGVYSTLVEKSYFNFRSDIEAEF